MPWWDREPLIERKMDDPLQCGVSAIQFFPVASGGLSRG
jgi:hypothetical protein